ncbi:hypothetical protein QBC38DRAFT_378038 [Podospora fimiseda]|uniref:Uncharacterized protein n=1 Tax=Podospora fimiseda TaxID=252190 RepID=A0AAN6YMX5_9PEZI|nr:hypothetical protein QBC38DRAFT_378038 [Podospora fimiseda]
MFAFDADTLEHEVLVSNEGSSPSPLAYHEYAAFIKRIGPGSFGGAAFSANGELSHKMLSEAGAGDKLFNQALREGYALTREGEFEKQKGGYDPTLRGRTRQVICRRRVNFHSDEDGSLDGLDMKVEDYDALRLHPATLQYIRRITTESMFWDRRHERLSLLLCFSSDPRPPYDFLSMTYDLSTRTSTMLVRDSYDPKLHDLDELQQYGQRMEACRNHWAHPLVTAVTMLQVQFFLSERAMAENSKEVAALELDVERMAGFDIMDTAKPGKGRGSISSGGTTFVIPKRPTELMKNAHEAFKRSVKFLDTISWMERAVKILLQAGDAIDEVRCDGDGDEPTSPFMGGGRVATGFTRARILEDPMSAHWHEIRQYLESLQQLCMSLETDRHMLELRCKSQIDIIFAKMAQEDNILTARMAVTSTRDSSSLKALAVITALFMPGDFMASIFGMSMWETWENMEPEDKTPLPPRFWLYFQVSIPLTIIILVLWRAWWVNQDRFFRKHLSKELSEERYWTEDRRPRKLEHSFIRDFFTLSARKDEIRSDFSALPSQLPYSLSSAAATQTISSREGSVIEGKSGSSSSGPLPPPPMSAGSAALRIKQIAFLGTDPRKEGGSRGGSRRSTFKGDGVV